MKQFKIFSFSFYNQIIKEIYNFKYEEFKLIFKFYNPKLLSENFNILPQSVQKFSFIEIFQHYINRMNSEEFFCKGVNPNMVKNQAFKPLISTTERMVDMVMSVKNIIYSFFFFFFKYFTE